MKILLTGASGFIGQAIHQTLTAQGHTVIRAVRKPSQPSDIAVNFEQDTSAATWLPRLQGNDGKIDAVINAVGILGGSEAQMMAVHAMAPAALAQAAAQAGVKQFVQVSALGVDSGLDTLYYRSKLAGEQGIRAAMPQAAVLRPSMVYGAAGAATQMFTQLTRLPLIALPLAGRMRVQPVHVSDVAAGVAALLTRNEGLNENLTIHAVGAAPLALADYLKSLASQLGRSLPLKLSAVLPMPMFAAKLSAQLMSHLPQQVWTPETLAMLVAGSQADAQPFTALLGRAPLAVDAFVKHGA
jgi:uncharacterized protein YbjT (DUF2867 family)